MSEAPDYAPDVEWAAVQIEQFVTNKEGATFCHSYCLAFPFMNDRDMNWLVAQVIGYAGEAGLDFESMHLGTFVSNLLIEAVGEDYEPYVLPHSAAKEGSLQLVGYTTGGMMLLLGDESWDPNLFYLRFSNCGCSKCEPKDAA